jgi:predicted ATPase
VLTALAVENYRSLRRLVLPMERLNVVTGANGSGKSNLYRALRLLADSARNGAVAALAREGGLASTLWAGSPGAGRSLRQGRPLVQGGNERRLLLGFAGDAFGYAMDLGLPPPAPTMFGSDPEIKAESVWAGPVLRPAALLADRGASGTVRIRRGSGDWDRLPLQTIREIGDNQAMDDAIGHAFPGSSIEITGDGGRFELTLRQPGLLRPLRAAEVSDGTLRYLLWAACLLTPRPPELLVLNEPETSLHPDLIGPLANLIVTASASTQIIVVTHAQPLVTALQDGSAHTIELIKEDGRTLVADQGILDEPAWHWPGRR